MKLEKNNKYNKRKSLGLAAILASGIILSGCANAKGEVIEPTRAEVVEVTPTATPVPTITPTPEPTPMPELSHEEEIALLGIKDETFKMIVANVIVFEYKIGEEKRVAFTYMPNYFSNGLEQFYDIFTQEPLFDLTEVPRSWEAVNFTKAVALNSNLEGATIVKGYAVCEVTFSHGVWGTTVSESEYKKIIRPDDFDEVFKVMVPIDVWAEIYLWAVSKDQRLSYIELGISDLVEEEKALVK